jgi:hypothetical protein
MNGVGWTTKPIYSTEGGLQSNTHTGTQVASVVTNNLNFFKRTDMGPLGFSMIYSCESPDGWGMWPGGVPNAGVTAFSNVSVPGVGRANADLAPVYNVVQHTLRDLNPHYNVSAPTGVSVIGAQISPVWNVKGRVSVQYSVQYNVVGVTPITTPSEGESIVVVRQPTDLDSCGQRLYDLIGDIAGGYR